MKRCPECRRDYYDDTLLYCLDDGTALLEGPASGSEPQTAILSVPPVIADGLTGATDKSELKTAILQPPATAGGSDSTEKHSFSARRGKQLATLVVAVVILVGGFFGYRYLSGPNAKQINSIAVMPFENRNSDADTDYLSDGLAESVIFRLTQLPDLRVSPTSSVMRYKGASTDVAKIAGELGVDAVMTGRLTKRGDNLNITVELVDARTNKSLWGEQYERKLSELLTTQREIVTEIVSKLQLKLSGESEQKLAKKYTDNNEAYHLYLKGKFYWNKRTSRSLKQAVDFYKQAIEKDPNFALAYSGLAESFVLFSTYEAGSAKDSMPQAKAAALRALKIDDSLADAHAALGVYYSTFEWNFPESEIELRRATELNPKYATAYHWLGANCLVFMKRFDEAIAAGRRAEELDPLSPVISADLGGNLLFARRYDEAISQLKRTLTLDPGFPLARLYLGLAYHAKENYPEAIAEFREALALTGQPLYKALLIRSLLKAGQNEEATQLFNELRSDTKTRNGSPSNLAVAYAAVGEKDEAFAFLEKDIAERSSTAPYYSISPWLDDLRDDPRFDELVKRVGIPE